MIFQCNGQRACYVHVFHTSLLHQMNPNANGRHVTHHGRLVIVRQW